MISHVLRNFMEFYLAVEIMNEWHDYEPYCSSYIFEINIKHEDIVM
jgi:hypothetical protein